tara:strand:- start:314 stop:616 length:303 start_codon:yes stop_codon:yes gene_type:complete
LKKFCFDLDGTLCTNTEGDYLNASPLENRIEVVNKLFDEGNEIIIFTARGSTTNIDWTKQTENQLSEWNVKYHKLLFGKPYADIYIDDKGHNSDSWFDNE